MKITDKLQKQISETKYLSVENTWRYRIIIRFFYEQFEAINYLLNKEDVFEELKRYDIFSDYTIEQCTADLEALRSFGNLIAIQDTGKVKSLDEFKNRRFRYELTQYTIEIERLTIKLENLKVEGASLEPSLLDRIKESLLEIRDKSNESDKVVYDVWNNLITDFEKLNVNYQDYIKQINSLKPDDMLRTGAYLLFKDKLIEYLKDFIRSLQNNVYDIEGIINSIGEYKEKVIFEKVARYHASIPKLDIITEQDVLENVMPKWRNIKRWFIGNEERDSEVEKLLEQTNEIIRKITRYAVQISESMNQTISRKEEYRRICELFLKCKNNDEADCLSSFVFGISGMCHIQGDFERATESVNSSVFEENAFEIPLKPRIRTYKEKAQRNIIIDKTEEKQKMREQILDERKKQQDLVNNYIKDGKIHFDNLGVINSYVRTTLLRWLSNTLGDINYTSKNENGNIVKLLNPEAKESKDKIVVSCEDGDFLMPAFVLEIS